jgi:hypothetical protein
MGIHLKGFFAVALLALGPGFLASAMSPLILPPLSAIDQILPKNCDRNPKPVRAGVAATFHGRLQHLHVLLLFDQGTGKGQLVRPPSWG